MLPILRYYFLFFLNKYLRVEVLGSKLKSLPQDKATKLKIIIKITTIILLNILCLIALPYIIIYVVNCLNLSIFTSNIPKLFTPTFCK